LFGIVAFGGVETAWADVVYSFTTIDVPGASYTVAQGINDSGQIVGWYNSTGRGYGFLDTGGSLTTIDVPGAIGTEAYGINDSGQIVGSYYDGRTHGFLYTGGSFTTIGVPGAVETDAYGINDSGQIVGEYFDSTKNGHGFLGTPTVVPEPRTLPILTGCLIGLAMALRRRSAPVLRK
jgi:probable HAF family extracellular repeat protein